MAQIASEWTILVNLQLSHLFSQKVAQIDLEWPILPNLQLFQSFPIKVAHFLPNFKIFVSGGKGGTLANFPRLTTLTRNGQFWLICNFSHLFPQKVSQIDLEWPILPDWHLFQSFPTKAAHFSPNFKIFIWGGTSANFSRFCNFLNCFQLKWLKMTHNG